MDKTDKPDLSAFEDTSNTKAIEDMAQWAALEERTLELMKKEHARRKDDLDYIREQIAQLLKSRGLKSLKLDSGLSPCRTTATKFFLKPEADQAALCQWFKSHGLGASVKQSVNFQTMQSVLSERKERGETLPKELVELTERDSLRMGNKSKFLAGQPVEFKATEIKIQNGKILIV